MVYLILLLGCVIVRHCLTVLSPVVGLRGSNKGSSGAEEQSGLWKYSSTSVQEEWGGGGWNGRDVRAPTCI